MANNIVSHISITNRNQTVVRSYLLLSGMANTVRVIENGMTLPEMVWSEAREEIKHMLSLGWSTHGG